MQYDYDHREQIPVYANGIKDVPERLRSHHWMVPVKFDQLPKLQLKVRMCCQKCEEIVTEKIWEVPGVFDVRATRPKKVIVVAMPYPYGLDDDEVLRKVKKIDWKAKFVDLDITERPKPQKIQEPVAKPPAPAKPPREKPTENHEENNLWPIPYRPLCEPSTSWPRAPLHPCAPPYQEPCVHYFHLLLLALLVSMLLYSNIQRMFPCCR